MDVLHRLVWLRSHVLSLDQNVSLERHMYDLCLLEVHVVFHLVLVLLLHNSDLCLDLLFLVLVRFLDTVWRILHLVRLLDMLLLWMKPKIELSLILVNYWTLKLFYVRCMSIITGIDFIFNSRQGVTITWEKYWGLLYLIMLNHTDYKK